MKLLVLTLNYQPDFCAGSFRSSALVKHLREEMDEDCCIEVITTMPNRYKSIKNLALKYEKDGNVIIRRIPVPDHDNKYILQFITFFVYFFKTWQIIINQKYDIIYASSARLGTAFLGASIAKRNNTPLTIDIRDIFTENIRDVFKSKWVKSIVLPIFKRVEKYTIKSATHINFVSEGFRNTFDYYQGKTTFFTNGIDEVFLGKNYDKICSNEPKIITYAGNIGEGQGLEKIIPEAAKALAGEYIFNIIGDGGTKHKLIRKLTDLQVDNVNLIPPVNQTDLIKYYQESDYLMLHLNHYKAFEKVLPSKIFEYATTNKTIIAGVGGYAKKFIQENIENTIIFESGDVESLVKALTNHQITRKDRFDFIKQYSRSTIMRLMAKSILAIEKSRKY